MMSKPETVPYYVRKLPNIVLAVCFFHLTAKGVLLVFQIPSMLSNTTHTHFGLNCVLALLLCILISLVFVDMIYRSYATFRYVIGMNIAVVACGFFLVGYLLSHTIEIGFAQLYWRNILDGSTACRQLGIGIEVDLDGSTGNPLEVSTNSEKTRCDIAVFSAFVAIGADLVINLFALPLHIFATAFSWTFSALYRPRNHDDYDD